MAVTLVTGQAAHTAGNLFAGTNSYIYTFPAALTSGNLVVMGITSQTRTVSSVAGSTTPLTISGAHSSWGNGNISLWGGVAGGADTTITITASGTINDTVRVCFLEFAGNSSDQSGATANGSANSAVNGTHSSGSVTPPTADNVVVCFTERANDTWTEDTTPAGWTQVTTGTALAAWAYLIQTSATAQSYDMTSTIARDSGMRIGAFAGSVAAATGNPWFAYAQQ